MFSNWYVQIVYMHVHQWIGNLSDSDLVGCAVLVASLFSSML